MATTSQTLIPSGPLRRLAGGALTLIGVAGTAAVVPLPWGGRAVLAASMLVVVVLMEIYLGAGPGGLLVGVRIHRRLGGGGMSPRVAVGRAALLGMASLVTLGIWPVLQVSRCSRTCDSSTWWDRLSDTAVSARARNAETTYSLEMDGRILFLPAHVIVGRAPEAAGARRRVQTLVLLGDDPSVSKTHALLESCPEGLRVTDLSSTNGTMVEVNGSLHRLQPGLGEFVSRGCKIYFGDAGCSVR